MEFLLLTASLSELQYQLKEFFFSCHGDFILVGRICAKYCAGIGALQWSKVEC